MAESFDFHEQRSGGLSVVGFVLTVCAIFSSLGWYVTDLQGGGAAAIGAGVSPERGEQIFWGKGTCHTCHSVGERGNMKRCPNQGESKDGAPMGERAVQRAKERSEQTGNPYTATDYLVESIAHPSAYVVKGYPDKLMPLTFTGQIDLDAEEVMSVVAYLQGIGGDTRLEEIARSMGRFGQPIYNKASLAGLGEPVRTISFPTPAWDPDVLLPEQFADYQGLKPGEREGWRRSKLSEEQKEIFTDVEAEWNTEGRAVFQRKKCWQCHEIAGEDFGAMQPGKVGPDLTSIGAIQKTEYIIESILTPNAMIVPPLEDHSDKGRSKMPGYAEQLKVQELIQLAHYLSNRKGPPPEAPDAAAADNATATEEPEPEPKPEPEPEPDNATAADNDTASDNDTAATDNDTAAADNDTAAADNDTAADNETGTGDGP